MARQYDAEWSKAVEPLLAMAGSMEPLKVHDVQGRRERTAGFFGTLVGSMPEATEVEISTHTMKTSDGAEIPIYRYLKKGSASTPGPAVLHFHGGGLIALSVPLLSKAIAMECQISGIQTFSVDYRLAPEYPTPSEDCYAGLLWLHEHAKEFNVDPTRILVSGESAGGNLAAAVALMARDRKLSPPLAKQVLVYPMLNDRTIKADPAVAPLLIWKPDDNITAWTAVLGDKMGTDDVSPHIAPARAKSLEGLPPTYIDVGDLDLFAGECLDYASRLVAANVPVELHVYPGVPHGFEPMGPTTSVVQKAMANRTAARATV